MMEVFVPVILKLDSILQLWLNVDSSTMTDKYKPAVNS